MPRSKLENKLRREEASTLLTSLIQTSPHNGSVTSLRPGKKMTHSKEAFERLLRDFTVQWSLQLNPEFVGAMLSHYSKLLDNSGGKEKTPLFREVLDLMIAERQKQGDSPDANL